MAAEVELVFVRHRGGRADQVLQLMPTHGDVSGAMLSAPRIARHGLATPRRVKPA